jgi:hypothetical protein
MATATNEYLTDVRRRIERVEVQAQRGTTDAKLRMQRYVDTLRREEEAARASAREQAAAVDERLEQLENELELAERRIAAEFAATQREFADAIEAGLERWDAFLDRLQAKAAARSGAAREQAEAAIADLRARRLSIDTSLSDVLAATGNRWRDARARVLGELDDLKRHADAARPN